MPTFSDDKSYEKFKKETEAFSSSSKISGDEKNKSGNPIKGKSPEIVNKYGFDKLNELVKMNFKNIDKIKEN